MGIPRFFRSGGILAWGLIGAVLLLMVASTALFARTALVRHEKLVECMRKATEGLVQAVAKEVNDTRKRSQPYSGTPKAKPAAGNAIIYNRVV